MHKNSQKTLFTILSLSLLVKNKQNVSDNLVCFPWRSCYGEIKEMEDNPFSFCTSIKSKHHLDKTVSIW